MIQGGRWAQERVPVHVTQFPGLVWRSKLAVPTVGAYATDNYVRLEKDECGATFTHLESLT